LRASRKCEGYEEPVRTGHAQKLPLEPASITTYSIPFRVPGSQADRQLLHYYCSQAAWNLSCCADPTLWTELILQRASYQPVVRNALVALSSLHKDFLCGELFEADPASRGSALCSPAMANVKTMSMVGRCHRQLKNYLSRPEASPDVALVCSVIFYTFESLLGESQRAIWHLDQGLILLRKCLADKSFDPHDPLIPRLSTLLHHLDIQASCFDDRRRPILELATDFETRGFIDVVPDSLFDLLHAEAVLDKLHNWILHHLGDTITYRGLLLQDLPPGVLAERLLLAVQLWRYEGALDKFATGESLRTKLSAATQRATDRHQRIPRLLVLRITLHAFGYLIKESIALLSTDPRDATDELYSLFPVHDHDHLAQVAASIENFEADLEASVAAIEALLDYYEPNCEAGWLDKPSAGSARTYTLSTQLIATLYFVSLKTTSKILVNKAIGLFSHPRLQHTRDGLWDAQTASVLVENLVKVRRQGSITQRRNGSDIQMHVSRNDPDINILGLKRIFKMSEKSGFPMMQSKNFTLVMGGERKDAGRIQTNGRASVPHTKQAYKAEVVGGSGGSGAVPSSESMLGAKSSSISRPGTAEPDHVMSWKPIPVPAFPLPPGAVGGRRRSDASPSPDYNWNHADTDAAPLIALPPCRDPSSGHMELEGPPPSSAIPFFVDCHQRKLHRFKRWRAGRPEDTFEEHDASYGASGPASNLESMYHVEWGHTGGSWDRENEEFNRLGSSSLAGAAIDLRSWMMLEQNG
jgi:hypothetical protein